MILKKKIITIGAKKIKAITLPKEISKNYDKNDFIILDISLVPATIFICPECHHKRAIDFGEDIYCTSCGFAATESLKDFKSKVLTKKISRKQYYCNHKEKYKNYRKKYYLSKPKEHWRDIKRKQREKMKGGNE